MLFGMLGDDALIGGDGVDRLEGWEGDDEIFGGADNDVLAGDFGRYEDPLFRRAGANSLSLPGSAGLFTSASRRCSTKSGNDFLDGGAGDDQMYGDGGDDTLFGRDGADVMYGDGETCPRSGTATTSRWRRRRSTRCSEMPATITFSAARTKTG